MNIIKLMEVAVSIVSVSSICTVYAAATHKKKTNNKSKKNPVVRMEQNEFPDFLKSIENIETPEEEKEIHKDETIESTNDNVESSKKVVSENDNKDGETTIPFPSLTDEDDEEDDEDEAIIPFPTLNDEEDEDEEEDEEDDEDEEEEDDEEDDEEDEDDVIDSTITDLGEDGLLVYHQVEEDDEEDDDDDSYIINGVDPSIRIKTVNGTELDRDDIYSIVEEAKEFLLSVYDDENAVGHDLAIRFTKEQLSSGVVRLDKDKEPENLMELLIAIDPCDFTNRELIFGKYEPNVRDDLRSTSVENKIVNELAEDDEDIEITSEMVEAVIQKIFNNPTSNHPYITYLTDCRFATQNNIEDVFPMMFKFEELVYNCYEAIVSGAKINRRTWQNRFSKVFNKTHEIIVAKTSDENVNCDSDNK